MVIVSSRATRSLDILSCKNTGYISIKHIVGAHFQWSMSIIQEVESLMVSRAFHLSMTNYSDRYVWFVQVLYVLLAQLDIECTFVVELA